MNTVTAELRSPAAKAKRLRRAGIIPCAVYGGSLPEPLLIQMDQRTVNRLLQGKRVGSKVQLEVGGKTIQSLIKEISRNSVNQEVEHIGFQALSADRKVNSVAQVVLLNKDSVDGLVEQMLFDIPYSAFPGDMIDTVTIDLTNYGVGSTLTVGELEAFKKENIDLHVDADAVVFKIEERTHAAATEEESSDENTGE